MCGHTYTSREEIINRQLHYCTYQKYHLSRVYSLQLAIKLRRTSEPNLPYDFKVPVYDLSEGKAHRKDIIRLISVFIAVESKSIEQ